MDEKIKKMLEEQKQLVEGIRKKWEEAEEGKFTKAEAKEYEEKANKRFEELNKGIEDIKKLNERMDELETKLQRPGSDPGDKGGKSVEHKAYEKWLRFGKGVLTDEETKMLESGARTSIDPKVLKAFGIDESKVLTISGDSGVSYLAPGDYVNEIIKGVTEISPIRSIADVKPTSKEYSETPKRTGQFSAAWTSEIGTRSERTGLEYGLERVPNHEMYALVKISKKSLEDSAFNLEAELTSEFAEQFAVAEGTAFVTGNAVGKPEGFLTNSDVDKSTVIFDASDDGIIINGMIDLVHGIKSAYVKMGSYLLANRLTMAYLRKAKDTNNKYYWEPDFQKATPGTFMGISLLEVPDMPNCADGAYSIAHGNFKKGYVISDRVQIEIQRLVELYAESGQVGFIARKRVGGQVVLAEAIKVGVGQA